MNSEVLKWISEGEALPSVAQKVLLATPRQSGEFWDLSVACILVQHEGVIPVPVKAGGLWPSSYYWRIGHSDRETHLVTGNNWWASLRDLPLPPLAVHEAIRGQDVIRQIGQIFIPQAKR